MFHKYMIFIFVFIHFVCGAPLVSTSLGVIRGVESDDGSYFSYLGIPYGVVNPANPFGHSSPHPPFDGIFEATDDSALCPQREEFNETLTGTLDCLHLSVFVPNSDAVTPKAVLIWMHGGRFEIGFYGRFLYGPKYLVRHDIIVISINYRLGPYGFMCTDHPKVPGNQGLKDQEMALKWVKENIANFGGDPEKITLSGNSAGSMSTDFHTIKYHQSRFYNQIIMQSGASLCPSFPAPNKNAPLLLAKYFGFETEDISAAIDFLAPIDVLEMVEASEALEFRFRPCQESIFEGVDGFLTHNWVANNTIPFAKDLNIIIGYNDEEGFTTNTDRDLSNIVNETLLTPFDITHAEFMGEEFVENFFFGDEDINMDVFKDIVEMRSDLTFIHPSVRAADRFLGNGVNKIYMYQFSYAGGRNFNKHLNNITRGGALHADEQGYQFDISYMEEPIPADQLVIDRMTTMWTNFVKYSDPTPTTSELVPVKWEAITASGYHYMDIGAELVPGTRPNNERMTFWDLFFEKYGHLQWMLLNDGHGIK